MIAPKSDQPQRIRDRLAGQHVLVTGSTGFLARAFVEKMLRSVADVGRIYLLVRQRSDGTSVRERVWKQVLGSSAFDRLRAMHGTSFADLCNEKIHVVAGDLTLDGLGIDPAEYEALTSQLTTIVNSAATVTFDERIDLAIELNTFGPQRLLQLARQCGSIPMLHVSTCYVCGDRKGDIPEDFSAPALAEQALPRCADGTFDLDTLIESVRATSMEIRHRYGADTEACRRELIDAGMRIAREHGWNDTYTFTKWLGEQLLLRDRGDVPLAVIRPAIIESSFDEPAPGWIDGLRMADPIIVAFGKGKLNEFPARKDVPIDLIPVDYVANAMLAVLPTDLPSTVEPPVYHCASSDANPLGLGIFVSYLEAAFLERPMLDDNGQVIRPGRLRCTEMDEFIRRWQRKRSVLRQMQAWFGTRGKRARRRAAALRQIEQVLYFAKIYGPYTHLDCRFLTSNLSRIQSRLAQEDLDEFPFDPRRIDWPDYVINRHVPGLRSFVLGTGGEPTGRIRASEGGANRSEGLESLTGATLFDVFQRSAERFGEKPALQIRRQKRWIRYTYSEALNATGSIMRRFQERGLSPGERIALIGESCPEWGLAYLAAMRAGLTVVPLDPQMSPAEAWSCARFVDARLMCVTPATKSAIESAREAGDAELVVLREPFVPPPGASRDALPDPVQLDGTEIASILFTSGTTVAPKAVQLSHRNFIANARALLQIHPVYTQDEFLSVLPQYHAFEFSGGFLCPLAGGATITYVDQLKGPSIVAAMKATGTTVMLVVPRMLRLFHDSIISKVQAGGALRRTAFAVAGRLCDWTNGALGKALFRRVHSEFGGRLRLFVSGGSALDPDLQEAFSRLGFTVCEGYGLTETAPVLTVNPLMDIRPGSVGRPLPNVEIDLRAQNLEGIGEVWVRGPNVMSGYLNNPEATDEVLCDGWFRTGDLGRVDADGYLYLTGRSKDLIVTSAGKNVYPDELELRYKDLPYMKELCVLAMPAADGLGDTVAAVVVIDHDQAASMDRSSIEREIRIAAEAVAETLPSHQRIAAFYFWDRELPKTSTLKAKRNSIRDMLLHESEAAQIRSEPATPEAHAVDEDDAQRSPTFPVVRDLLARHASKPPESITPSMNLLLDLGIDSIGKIEVIGDVEAVFGMQIDENTAARISRVADIERLVRDRRPKKSPKRAAALWHRKLAAPEQAAVVNGDLPGPLKPMRWAVRGTVWGLMHSYVRVRGVGVENIPKSGPFILAPNHSSHLDGPAVLVALHGARRVWIAGAQDYFFNNSVKRLLFGKLLDTIPFDRQADGVQGLRRCGVALQRGDGLLLFPEGTRSRTGRLQTFKIGVAVLAMEHNAPIVPVYVHRAFDLLRKGQRIVRPGSITVTFGQPVQPARLDEVDDPYTAFRTITKQVQASVVQMARGV